MSNRDPMSMVHLDDAAVVTIAAKRVGCESMLAARELGMRLQRRSEPGRSRLADLCRTHLGCLPHEMRWFVGGDAPHVRRAPNPKGAPSC